MYNCLRKPECLQNWEGSAGRENLEGLEIYLLDFLGANKITLRFKTTLTIFVKVGESRFSTFWEGHFLGRNFFVLSICDKTQAFLGLF